MNTATLPSKEIPLKSPLKRVVFDREGGEYRGALYRTVSSARKTYDVRDTAKAKTLTDLFYALFPESEWSRAAKETMAYVRSTAWGSDLI